MQLNPPKIATKGFNWFW